MTLPIAVSVPHAGLLIPPEAAPFCQLTREQIIRDGDEFAAEIYELRNEVTAFITTDTARAVIDLNRAPDDRRPDGVVKTHTIYGEQIYHERLPETVTETLLDRYYHPYHADLSKLVDSPVLFGVDCHTMAAEAPPISPTPGSKRPEICLGNLEGRSFPNAWTAILLESFRALFEGYSVTLNEPFAGGYITQRHCSELPWLQIEVSRSEFLPASKLRDRIVDALTVACEKVAVEHE